MILTNDLVYNVCYIHFIKIIKKLNTKLTEKDTTNIFIDPPNYTH